MPSTKNPEEYLERIVTIKNVEARHKCKDYLDYLQNTPNGAQKSATLHKRRQIICSWKYSLCDFCDIDRDIVQYSMNLLDRFLSNLIHSNRLQCIDNYLGSQYGLLSLTALYLAMKLDRGQSKSIQISRFVDISGRKFTSRDIIGMEMEMLEVLGWSVFPPSPVEYVENFISLLFYFHRRVQSVQYPQGNKQVFDKMVEIALYLTELAVVDYFFVTKNASTIALASVLIAMERLQDHVSEEEYSLFLRVLRTHGFFQDDDFLICRHKLQELFVQNASDTILIEDESDSEHKDELGHGQDDCEDGPERIPSPVSIAQL